MPIELITTDDIYDVRSFFNEKVDSLEKLIDERDELFAKHVDGFAARVLELEAINDALAARVAALEEAVTAPPPEPEPEPEPVPAEPADPPPSEGEIDYLELSAGNVQTLEDWSGSLSYPNGYRWHEDHGGTVEIVAQSPIGRAARVTTAAYLRGGIAIGPQVWYSGAKHSHIQHARRANVLDVRAHNDLRGDSRTDLNFGTYHSPDGWPTEEGPTQNHHYFLAKQGADAVHYQLGPCPTSERGSSHAGAYDVTLVHVPFWRSLSRLYAQAMPSFSQAQAGELCEFFLGPVTFRYEPPGFACEPGGSVEYAEPGQHAMHRLRIVNRRREPITLRVGPASVRTHGWWTPSGIELPGNDITIPALSSARITVSVLVPENVGGASCLALSIWEPASDGDFGYTPNPLTAWRQSFAAKGVGVPLVTVVGAAPEGLQDHLGAPACELTAIGGSWADFRLPPVPNGVTRIVRVTTVDLDSVPDRASPIESVPLGWGGLACESAVRGLQPSTYYTLYAANYVQGATSDWTQRDFRTADRDTDIGPGA